MHDPSTSIGLAQHHVPRAPLCFQSEYHLPWTHLRPSLPLQLSPRLHTCRTILKRQELHWSSVHTGQKHLARRISRIFLISLPCFLLQSPHCIHASRRLAGGNEAMRKHLGGYLRFSEEGFLEKEEEFGPRAGLDLHVTWIIRHPVEV